MARERTTATVTSETIRIVLDRSTMRLKSCATMNGHMRCPAVVDVSGPRSHKVVHDAARTLEEGGLMPRPTVGHVFERLWADAETVSYGAQIRAYGRYEKVTFGTNKQGWNRTRAELETERIAQQIDRGTWVPPRLEPRGDRLEETMATLGVPVDESFRVFAKRWWRSKQLGLDEDTINDYQWRLGYLQRFFDRYRLSEITQAGRPIPG